MGCGPHLFSGQTFPIYEALVRTLRPGAQAARRPGVQNQGDDSAPRTQAIKILTTDPADPLQLIESFS